ncbi:hypothetical protein GGI05_000807 [Coemansia sp. RSA 2603]|nr:hypothetical protein GGI05_000807 [Coemansia sp. RSA 2603]
MEYHNWHNVPESNIVFLGNVAYNTTEEQLRKMLELAGPVVDIKLVFDPQTGRAKGYGFCQYPDANIAASAIKNLNDHLVDGRNIKVGYADRKRVQRSFNTDGTTLGSVPGEAVSRSIGSLQVARLVDELGDAERRTLIEQFAQFARANPQEAREELAKNRGLAWALVRAMESEGVVDPGRIAEIKGAGYPQAPVPVPPPEAMAMAAAEAEAMVDETSEIDNVDVLRQLLSLTDEQLAQLPEDHRKQIVELKQQLQGSM